MSGVVCVYWGGEVEDSRKEGGSGGGYVEGYEGVVIEDSRRREGGG